MDARRRIPSRTARELRPPLTRLRGPARGRPLSGMRRSLAAAPCTLACPAQVDVPGLSSRCQRPDVRSAAETILRRTFWADVCARLPGGGALRRRLCARTRRTGPIRSPAAAFRDRLGARGRAASGGLRAHGAHDRGCRRRPCRTCVCGRTRGARLPVTVLEARDESVVLSAPRSRRTDRARTAFRGTAGPEALGVRFRLGEPVTCLDELTASTRSF